MVQGCVPSHHIYHNTHHLCLMNHFDLLPLLELNFSFESFESLQRVRVLTNELEKTITGIIINECDEIFVATHSRMSE